VVTLATARLVANLVIVPALGADRTVRLDTDAFDSVCAAADFAPFDDIGLRRILPAFRVAALLGVVFFVGI